MRFQDRMRAGLLLAEKLEGYAGGGVVVYALPRGGVVVGAEVARGIGAPLDIIITRKIHHPNNPEYAIAAVAEDGHIVYAREGLSSVDEGWLEREIYIGRQEAARRRKKYLRGKGVVSSDGKIAIIVDDGAATGLTLRAGIIEVRHHNPKELIIAVPVVSESVAEIFRREADELIALQIPSDGEFLGAVGSYYDSFPQVTDGEVIKILDGHKAWLQVEKGINI